MKLLLIDDDEELCSELTEVLEAEGFTVDIALDGLQGLQQIQSGQHQIIVLDLKLPGLNGYGVLKDIRKNAQSIKVLVLSGKPMMEPLLKAEGIYQEEEERTLKLADVVMNKPFQVTEFLQQIKVLASAMVEKNQ